MRRILYMWESDAVILQSCYNARGKFFRNKKLFIRWLKLIKIVYKGIYAHHERVCILIYKIYKQSIKKC